MNSLRWIGLGLLFGSASVWPLDAWPAGAPNSPPAAAAPKVEDIDQLIAQLGSKSFAARELAQKKLMLLDEAVPALQKALKSPSAEVATRAAQILKAIADRHIDELIAQLGSKSNAVRELAQKKLVLLDEAVPALQKALQSPSAEVATRAAQILKAITERQANEWLVRLRGLVEQGEVDQVVEQVVYNWHPKHKDAAWKLMGQLMSTLIKSQQRGFAAPGPLLLADKNSEPSPLFFDLGGLKLPRLPKEGTALKDKAGEEVIVTDSGGGALIKTQLVRAETIVVKNFVSDAGIFIAAGSIQWPQQFMMQSHRTILVTNSDLATGGFLNVCDGEYRGNTHARLIFARAGVTCGEAVGCIILSGGPVRFTNPAPRISGSIILSASAVEIPKGAKVIDSIIKQFQPDALGPVKFFEPARVGIEVELSKGLVRVKKLDPAKAFAKAGLQIGDVLLALDKNPVKSVEGFRKQLRHSLAVQKQLTFEVRRGEKTITLSVQNKS